MTGESDKSVVEGKDALRALYKARLRGLCQRGQLSDALVSRLAESELLAAASIMVGFMPKRQEPDKFGTMEPWLVSGRRLFLPVY